MMLGDRFTINTWTLEDLACLTARSQAITLDLWLVNEGTGIATWRLTLRLRQDLQFIVSRGSTVARRGVRRSMLTWGRDMACGIEVREGEE